MKVCTYLAHAELEVGFQEGEGDLTIDQFTACCFLEAKKKPNGDPMRLMVDFGYENAIQVLEALENETA